MSKAGRIIDTVIGQFAPRTALRRMAARNAMDAMTRGYDAAGKGRSGEGWRATGSSADAEIGMAGAVLRNRMRDLVRNAPLVANAVQVLVNNIVGTGIRPRAVSTNRALNRRVDRLWDAWSRQCDAHGHTDFHGLTALAVRQMIEGGDCFALMRPQRQGAGRTVPLKVELREADHLDEGRHDSRPDGSAIRAGIEYGPDGARRAYWMFDQHPGDTAPVFSRRFESRPIPAARVAHLFERQRVQSRGVPWGAPAMAGLRDHADWQEAEMVRKRTEACLVGVVLGDEDMEEGIAPTVVDREGHVIEQFGPGMIAYARGGRDIKFNQPGVAGGIGEWNRVQMHIISAGLRVPYVLVTNDLSQVNFSSIRAGLNEFRRMVEQIQWQVVIPMFCDPVWDWFVLQAQTAGLLPEGVEIRAEWAPPRFESVNPLQDAQADLLEVRAGFSSLAQVIAKRGYDPAAVLKEQADVLAMADALKLVLDSDARRTSRAGNAATAAPAEAAGNGDDGDDAQDSDGD